MLSDHLLRRRAALARALTTAAATTVTALGLPAAASAADYVVLGCAEPATLSSPSHTVLPTEGWFLETAAHASGNYCPAGGAAQGLYSETDGGSAPHAARWQFNAPAGTSIDKLTTWYKGHLSAGAGWASPQVVFEAQHGGAWTNTAPSFGNQTSSPIDGGGTFHTTDENGASAVRFGVRCDLAGPCSTGGMPYLMVRSTGVWLDDSLLPTVAPVTGSLTQGSYAQGVGTLQVGAADQGGGLYKLKVRFGPTTLYDQVPNVNGGRCATIPESLTAARHVAAPVPCSLSEARTLSVDTASVPDGRHDVVVTAEDIAGNARTATTAITVDNRAPVAGTVDVTGYPRENQSLTAEVAGFDGQGVSYDYRWQRCAVDGGTCVDIGGAAQRTYTLQTADVGHRVRSKVLATDHGGTTTAYSNAMAGGGSQGGVVENDPTNDPAGGGTGGGTGGTGGTGGPGGTGGTGGTGGAGGAAGGSAGAGSGASVGAPTPGTSQPVAVPNGENPSRLAKVTALIDRRGRTVTSRFGRTVRITGRLVDEHGAPIRNAQVEVQAVRRVPRAAAVPEGAIRTDAGGRFSYVARANASRRLTFTYRAYSTDRELTSQSTVTLLVRAAGTFAATPRTLRNGQTVTFAGRLKGGLLPRAGTVVEVQVRYCASRGRCEWRVVKGVRTKRTGAYRATYTFRRTTTTTTYAFRARARADSAWPFLGGMVGRTAKVTVRP